MSMAFKGVELWLEGDAERQAPTETVATEIQLTPITISDIVGQVVEALRGHSGKTLTQLIVVMITDEYQPSVPFLPDARFDLFSTPDINEASIQLARVTLKDFLNNRIN